LTATKRTGEVCSKLRIISPSENGSKNSLLKIAEEEDLASLKEVITTPFLGEMSRVSFKD
jgi:hypothetical protein